MFDCSISSTVAVRPLGNSDDVVVSVSIDFPSICKRDHPFYFIAYGHSCADWDGLCDNFRDVPREDILKLGASVAAA